jgi:LPXTG-motif cell wall-anchored protein
VNLFRKQAQVLSAITLSTVAFFGLSSAAQADPLPAVELTGFQATSGVAFSPDGSTAYLVQGNDGTLLGDASLIVLDARTLSPVSASIPAGYRGAGVNHAIAMAPNGSKAYVSLGTGVIRPFYPSTLTFGPAISVGTAGIGQIVFTPNGTKAYVAITDNGSGALVKEIDVTSDRVTSTISTCAGPNGLAITPDGLKLFVNCADGNVAVVETTGNTVLTTFTPVGHLQGTTISMAPDGASVYVTAFLVSTTVTSVIDTTSYTVEHQFTDEPKDVAFSADGSIAYLFSADSGKLLPAATSSFSLGTPIDVTSPSPGMWFLMDKNPVSEQYWITGGESVFVVGSAPEVTATNPGAVAGDSAELAKTGSSFSDYGTALAAALLVLSLGIYLTRRRQSHS